MHILNVISLAMAMFAVNVMVAPAPSPAPASGTYICPTCLTHATAAELVTAYVSLTSGATNFDIDVAEALLAPDFSDDTSSVASVIDGGMAYSCKSCFVNKSYILTNWLQAAQHHSLSLEKHSTGPLSLPQTPKQEIRRTSCFRCIIPVIRSSSDSRSSWNLSPCLGLPSWRLFLHRRIMLILSRLAR